MPESIVKDKNLLEVIKNQQKAEKSYKPDKGSGLYMDSSCSDVFETAVNIQPFSSANKLYKIQNYKARELQITFVSVKWLHLKVKKNVACSEGFDEPASLFCDSSKDRVFDIYIPLQVLDINHSIQLKKGRIVSVLSE